MATTPQRLFLLGALNERGIVGKPAVTLLRHFSHERIVRQIDYYDFEISSFDGLGLPLWAASPWLLHRIKRDTAAPRGYRPAIGSAVDRLASL